jgi:hypothetical protein
MLAISQFGAQTFTSITGMFYGCLNLTSLPADASFMNTFSSGVNALRGTGLTSLPSSVTFESWTDGTSALRGSLITSLPSAMLLPNLVISNNMLQSTPISSLPSAMVLPNLESAIDMFNGGSLTNLPSGIKLTSLISGVRMFLGNTINTTRYSQLLVDLEADNPNNSVTFHGGNSKYNTTGQTARNILTASPRNWTITDGGLE